ncbi:MAG: hypothetical protein A3E54_05285 [Gammaproteobacteria bacterium RIFCSPHIGHO2_12_FULL_41_25]|nr:MAG: hypothetical protein A3E54_05285 [Gammaproteobacteria bacterium RIFCSPHIGHO2_12_FULL_41_25]OGT85825.1 MAG: hypothetical protein A3G86_03910 [Gammaproteobacteria bacterium RIFCSPLOWO2_12_FULL_42_18]
MRRHLFLLLLFFSFSGVADTFWRCTAINHAGAKWVEFGAAKLITLRYVQGECKKNNNDKTCRESCFPPMEYWRCLSHDTTPTEKNVTQKPGSWYWSSTYKQVAMNGALEACLHNSAFGGCHVNSNSCAAS